MKNTVLFMLALFTCCSLAAQKTAELKPMQFTFNGWEDQYPVFLLTSAMAEPVTGRVTITNQFGDKVYADQQLRELSQIRFRLHANTLEDEVLQVHVETLTAKLVIFELNMKTLTTELIYTNTRQTPVLVKK
jgi:hypothetical protein